MLKMFLFRKNLCSLFPFYYSFVRITTLSPSSHAHLPKCFLVSSTNSLNQDPPTNPHFMVEYLIDSLGLSLEKAAKASQKLTHLKTPEKPDSVLCFLREQGFSNEHIAEFVSYQPNLLTSSLEKTLEPNMKALLDVGLSWRGLTELLRWNPHALRIHGAASRVRFWKDFLGGDETKLLKAFRKNRGFVTNDIDSSIAPKIALLKEFGFSESQIKRMVVMMGRLITSSLDSIKLFVKRTEELGFARGSQMFVYGLYTMTNVSVERIRQKMELFKSFGWSEHEFFSALRKAPLMVLHSEKKIREKLAFLSEEVGCEPSYVASHPVLLMCSLEKRLIPRHNVLQILKSRGISCGSINFYSVMCMSDSVFIKKYIRPHHLEVPELHEAFIAAGGGQKILT